MVGVCVCVGGVGVCVCARVRAHEYFRVRTRAREHANVPHVRICVHAHPCAYSIYVHGRMH